MWSGFPNLEIVRSLQALNGRNSMESEQMADRKKGRVQSVFQIVNGVIQVIIHIHIRLFFLFDYYYAYPPVFILDFY